MLKIEELEVYYGYVIALKGINLQVKEKTITALLGANGAGKSTTLNTISGLIRAKKGRINYKEKDITNEDSSKIVKAGIVQCPEGRMLFPSLTVKENLLLGAYNRNNRTEILQDIEDVLTLFPILSERKKQMAGTLSGGEQQMLAIARALMAAPQLLMLDEPSLGLAPKIAEQIFDRLIMLNKERNLTILLVEQNANAALAISDYAYILETGKIGLTAKGKELLQNPLVRQKYLGT